MQNAIPLEALLKRDRTIVVSGLVVISALALGIYSLPSLGYETNGYGNGYALDAGLGRLGFGSAICDVGSDDGSDDGPFRSSSDADLCRSPPKTPENGKIRSCPQRSFLWATCWSGLYLVPLATLIQWGVTYRRFTLSDDGEHQLYSGWGSNDGGWYFSIDFT